MVEFTYGELQVLYLLTEGSAVTELISQVPSRFATAALVQVWAFRVSMLGGSDLFNLIKAEYHDGCLSPSVLFAPVKPN